MPKISCAILVDQISFCFMIQLSRVVSHYVHMGLYLMQCTSLLDSQRRNVLRCPKGKNILKCPKDSSPYNRQKNHKAKNLGCSQHSLMKSKESEKFRVPNGPTLARLRFMLLRILFRTVLWLDRLCGDRLWGNAKVKKDYFKNQAADPNNTILFWSVLDSLDPGYWLYQFTWVLNIWLLLVFFSFCDIKSGTLVLGWQKCCNISKIEQQFWQHEGMLHAIHSKTLNCTLELRNFFRL